MLIEVGFDPNRTNRDQMLLPRQTDRAVLTPHRSKEAFAFNMDLITRDRLERAAGLNLGRYINQTLARAFL